MNVKPELREDGSVVLPAAFLSLLATLLQARLREDYRRHGAWRSGGLDVVHVLAKAATVQIAFPNGVPLAELHGDPSVNMSSVISRSVPEQQPLSVAEAAERRGCSEPLVRRMCRTGALRAHKTGRDWMIDPEQFQTTPEEG